MCIWGPDPLSEHSQLKELSLARSEQKIVQRLVERAGTAEGKKKHSKTQRWVDKMQKKRKAHKHTARQQDSQRRTENPSCSGDHLLTVLTKSATRKKLIQALWSSKNDEEPPNHLAQVGKATLKKKKKKR